jgi:hypothetical protein
VNKVGGFEHIFFFKKIYRANRVGREQARAVDKVGGCVRKVAHGQVCPGFLHLSHK